MIGEQLPQWREHDNNPVVKVWRPQWRDNFEIFAELDAARSRIALDYRSPCAVTKSDSVPTSCRSWVNCALFYPQLREGDEVVENLKQRSRMRIRCAYSHTTYDPDRVPIGHRIGALRRDFEYVLR